MTKTVLVLMMFFMFFQTAKAQKQDTILLYMANGNKIVETKDSADYLLQVMMPPDSSTGVKINQVKEFSLTGKILSSGTAIIYTDKNNLNLRFDGPYISFYPSGHRREIMNFKNGTLNGDNFIYYPNGKLYCHNKYETYRMSMIECKDSTGKILTENGNGIWIKFNANMKNQIGEGVVKNGHEYGEWHGKFNDTVNLTWSYDNFGALIKSSSLDKSGSEHIYSYSEVLLRPSIKPGTPHLPFKFINNDTVSSIDTTGKDMSHVVIVTFIAEKNLTLSNIIILKSPGEKETKEAIANLTPNPYCWMPALQNDMPVRVRCTVLFDFAKINE